MFHSDESQAVKARRYTVLSAFFIVLVLAVLSCAIVFSGHGGLALAADGPDAEGGAIEITEPAGDADSAEPETIVEALEDEREGAGAAKEAPETPEETVDEPASAEPDEAAPDTKPPVVEYAAAAVKLGRNVTPSTFVIHYEDESGVSLRFAEKPDTSEIGEYPVTIIAEDTSGNRTVVQTTLYVCDRVIELEFEEKTYTGLQLREKLGTMHGYKPSIQQLKVKKEGASSFELKKGDTLLYIGVHIRDTTRPKAKAVEQVCYLGYPRQPEEFVKDVTDEQDVSIEFLTEPNWDLPGEREVAIALTDASYNRCIIRVSATFKRDDIPPVLTVSLSPYHYVGDAVAYMKGVVVNDNLDPNCEITVDKSQVKYRRVGTYPVTYTATDRDGNSSSVTVEISFREPSVTDEMLDELAESILDNILKDNMSVAQQIKAIYDYCRYKIRYTGDSDKTDWKGEAYRGLTEFKGDCFTYYSASFLLLNKIEGVEVMSVERLGGRTNHYWCLVNVGTGWYHYDTCPNHIYGTCFMRTNGQLHNGEGKAYWKFDMSLFPEVATKSFKMF